MKRPGVALLKAREERAAEIADAKAVIEGRVRLAQVGVVRNVSGRRGT